MGVQAFNETRLIVIGPEGLVIDVWHALHARLLDRRPQPLFCMLLALGVRVREGALASAGQLSRGGGFEAS